MQQIRLECPNLQNTKDRVGFIYSFWSGHFWVRFRSTQSTIKSTKKDEAALSDDDPMHFDAFIFKRYRLKKGANCKAANSQFW